MFLPPVPAQPQYLILSLEKTNVANGCVAFLRPFHQGVTFNLSEAGRFDEDVVNNDLDYYDDGLRHRAVLAEAVEANASPVLLLNELTSGALKASHNRLLHSPETNTPTKVA